MRNGVIIWLLNITYIKLLIFKTIMAWNFPGSLYAALTFKGLQIVFEY